MFKKITAKYFVDASGDAIISELLDAPMQKDNHLKQAETFYKKDIANKIADKFKG